MSDPKDVNKELIEACKTGRLDEVGNLINEGADPNFVGEHNLTPLLWICSNRERESVVRYLLQKGANVNYDGFGEGTALMLAAYAGEINLLTLYLEFGARVDCALPRGGETALHMAAVKGKTDAMKLLVQAKANTNQRANTNAHTEMFSGGAQLWGETPLHFAAAYGDVLMIQTLFDGGADKTVENAHGEWPLAYAGRHKRPREILKLLA